MQPVRCPESSAERRVYEIGYIVRSRDLNSLRGFGSRWNDVGWTFEKTRTLEKKTALNLIFSVLIVVAIMLRLLLFSAFFWELFSLKLSKYV